MDNKIYKIALPFQTWRQFYYLMLNQHEMETKHGYNVWQAIYNEYGNPQSYLGQDDIGRKQWKKDKMSKQISIRDIRGTK